MLTLLLELAMYAGRRLTIPKMEQLFLMDGGMILIAKIVFMYNNQCPHQPLSP
jgi:hypothetical protein